MLIVLPQIDVGLAKIETIIGERNKELQKIEDAVLYNVDQVCKSLQRLEEIELRPNPLTEVDYINLLIRSEEQQVKPGWQDRVKYLNDVKKIAQTIAKVKSGKQFQKSY